MEVNSKHLNLTLTLLLFSFYIGRILSQPVATIVVAMTTTENTPWHPWKSCESKASIKFCFQGISEQTGALIKAVKDGSVAIEVLGNITKAIGVPQKFIEAGKKIAETFPKLAKVLENVAPKILSVVNGISNVLNAVGPIASAASAVLSLVSLFIPPPKSPEMVAITEMRKEMAEGFNKTFKMLEDLSAQMNKSFEEVKNLLRDGFKRMENRFDIVETLLADLSIHIELTAAVSAYREKRVIAKTMVAFFKHANSNLSSVAIEIFKEQCKQHHPRFLLTWIRDHLFEELPSRAPGHLYNSIWKHVKYNLTLLIEWNTVIASDIVDLTPMYGGCLGFAHKLDRLDMQYVEAELNDSSKIVNEINEKMVTTLIKLQDNFIEEQLVPDVSKIMLEGNLIPVDWSGKVHQETLIRKIRELIKGNRWDFLEWLVVSVSRYNIEHQAKNPFCWLMKTMTKNCISIMRDDKSVITNEVTSPTQWWNEIVIMWYKPLIDDNNNTLNAKKEFEAYGITEMELKGKLNGAKWSKDNAFNGVKSFKSKMSPGSCWSYDCFYEVRNYFEEARIEHSTGPYFYCAVHDLRKNTKWDYTHKPFQIIICRLNLLGCGSTD